MSRHHLEQALDLLRGLRGELRTEKQLEEDAHRRAEIGLCIADSAVITNRLNALMGKKE